MRPSAVWLPCCRAASQAQLSRVSTANQGLKDLVSAGPGLRFLVRGRKTTSPSSRFSSKLHAAASFSLVIFSSISTIWINWAAQSHLQTCSTSIYPEAMRWSLSPWFWFGVAHVHSPQYLPSSSLAPSKCSGFISQPLERSNSTFCFNNNCLKTTCGMFVSSPAVLKGEEKGDSGVLLALHMCLVHSSPLVPPALPPLDVAAWVLDSPHIFHAETQEERASSWSLSWPCLILYWWGKTAALILSHGRCSNRAEIIFSF